jgi:hypothetical protein
MKLLVESKIVRFISTGDQMEPSYGLKYRTKKEIGKSNICRQG